MTKAFASSLLGTIPKPPHLLISEEIQLISMGKQKNQKGNPLLLFKILHKLYLMRMDILQRKGIAVTFLGIKADRNSLNRSDIIHRALLFKISQCDMTVLFINFNRRNRSRHLLDQSQPLLPIFFIGPVHKLLQSGASKTPGIPGCHFFTSFKSAVPIATAPA